MARTLEITSKKNAFHLLVDGKEIEGVKSYTLSQSVREVTTVTMEVCVVDSVKVEIEAEQ